MYSQCYGSNLWLWDVNISLSVISKTVMVKFMVPKHFIDFFSIGHKDLWARRGTLRNTTVHSELQLSNMPEGKWKVCVQPDRQELNQLRAESATPNRCWRILRNLWWSTVSNAEEKSNATTAPRLPWSIAEIRSSSTLTSAVSDSVEWHLRLADWNDVRIQIRITW